MAGTIGHRRCVVCGSALFSTPMGVLREALCRWGNDDDRSRGREGVEPCTTCNRSKDGNRGWFAGPHRACGGIGTGQCRNLGVTRQPQGLFADAGTYSHDLVVSSEGPRF